MIKKLIYGLQVQYVNEMLIGKCVFNAEDLDELVQKVENRTYTIPTNLSKEVISFLNGMLQYDPNQRLTIEK